MTDDGMTDIRDFFGVDYSWAEKACEILKSDDFATWTKSVDAALAICESECQKLYVAYQFGLAIGRGRSIEMLGDLFSGLGD